MKNLVCIGLLMAGSAWSITYRDTSLTGTLTGPAVLAGTITVSGSLSNTVESVVDILPGTTFKGQGRVSFCNLTAIGTAKDPIRFDSLSSLTVELGILDYCSLGKISTKGRVNISHATMADVSSLDGPVTVKTSIVRAKSIYAASGAGFFFYNTLFPDSVFMSVNSIQNNYGSSGYLLNCTFARGLDPRAISAATQAVSIQFKNCAFVDSLKKFKGPPTNYVYFDHCMGSESLFIDASAGNYHLRENSPAKDTGLVDSLNTGASAKDLDGYSRVFGKAVDLGAFEYQPIPVFITGPRMQVTEARSYTLRGGYLEVVSSSNILGSEVHTMLDLRGRRIWRHGTKKKFLK